MPKPIFTVRASAFDTLAHLLNYEQVAGVWWGEQPDFADKAEVFRLKTHEQLVQALEGAYHEPTEVMKQGSEFHYIMEKIRGGSLDKSKLIYQWDWAFIETCAASLPTERIHEVAASKMFGEGALKMQITGHTDFVCGDDLGEIKTKFSQYEYRQFRDSWQWQIYLWLFEAERIDYHVFDFGKDAEQPLCAKIIPSFTFDKSQVNYAGLFEKFSEMYNFIIHNNVNCKTIHNPNIN